MRILYLDCFSGISGDMMIGALADLGITPSTFEWELAKLDLGDYHLHFERQTRGGVSGVKFDVHAGATHIDPSPDAASSESDHPGHSHHSEDHAHEHEHHPHEHADSGIADSGKAGQPERSASRSFSAIRELLQTSELSDFVKRRAQSIFRRIGDAESKIHGVSIEEVQFHEIGTLDSIADIVLTCIGIEALQVERVYFSELVDGQGTFRCTHGEYPLPAPATLEILKTIPIRQVAVPFELITPTGAAIVAEFQHAVGALPNMRPLKIGYGLGTRELSERANVLRAVLGELEESPSSDRIVEFQANIDDLSPEILGAVQDRLLKAGALDAFFTPIQMKKNRPGILLSVLSRPSDRQRIQELLFAETSTFGVRYREVDRVTLDRELVQVETSVGLIQIKVGRLDGKIFQVSPEFESCKAAAERSRHPLKRIYELAVEAFWSSPQKSPEGRSDELIAG
jgi:pyridinium-3,5-bisthiocarboxylic acid mononucleotide nickel chelatase